MNIKRAAKICPSTNLVFDLRVGLGTHALTPSAPIVIHGGEPEIKLSLAERLSARVPYGMQIGARVCLSPSQARVVRDALTVYLDALRADKIDEWDWDYTPAITAEEWAEFFERGR